MRRSRLAALLLGALPLFPGCDPAASPTVPVSGRVRYRGVPLHTGSIVFIPDATRGTSGPLSRAEIQPDGSYRLRLLGPGGPGQDGAVIGWHCVTLHSVEEPTPQAGQPAALSRSLLPVRYRDPELSGLVREVKAGEENRIDFDLE